MYELLKARFFQNQSIELYPMHMYRQLLQRPPSLLPQEVDGESLLSLDPEIMVKLMQLKTGPALRIHRHIIALKQQFGVS